MKENCNSHIPRIYYVILAVFFITTVVCTPFSWADDKENDRLKATEDGIVLNFNEADLSEVVRLFAEQLDINYIVDSSINGRVTIHTSGTLPKKDLFLIFNQILELNGLTIIKEEGDLYKIERIKDSPRMEIPLRYGDEKSDLAPQERIIIQIIPLKHISPNEMVKLLSSFISASGTMIAHNESKNLIIIDQFRNIKKILKLIEVFDINIFDSMHYKIFKPNFHNATELSESLKQILTAYDDSIEDVVKCIPLENINAMIVLSKEKEAFEKIGNLFKLLDTPVDDKTPKIYIYSVKNGEAKELSQILENVFTNVPSDKNKTEKTTEEKNEISGSQHKGNSSLIPSTNESLKKNPSETEVRTITVQKTETREEKGILKGEVRISADEIRNKLIIEALPSDYQIIQNILEKLDVLPRQVLIEVTLAEISLDESTELGVEWTYLKGNGEKLTTSLLNAYMGATGMRYVIGQTNRWTSALSALATEKKVNIISSPSVLASDNKEAQINVSTEIPVASTQYERDSTSNPILETNVQYRNTGVILSVTPHINEFGLVSMDISQEVSEQSGSVQVGSQNMPSFFKRSVNTSLTVNNNQTIVIGGLIRESKTKGVSGVPCIGKIPFMSYLFGKESQSMDKTELIILITPRVISTLEEVDRITEEFRIKVGQTGEFLKKAD